MALWSLQRTGCILLLKLGIVRKLKDASSGSPLYWVLLAVVMFNFQKCRFVQLANRYSLTRFLQVRRSMLRIYLLRHRLQDGND